MEREQSPVFRLIDGLRFSAGPETWQIEPIRIHSSTWVGLFPDGPDPLVDPSTSLARILATLSEPIRGAVDLFGQDVYKLEYGARQRLRARIGFVHGYGGLLFNRSVRENILLPVSVHAGLHAEEERELVDGTLAEFSLDQVADLLPHEMDGSTRWRVCLARALVLKPKWVVLEGLGNWEMDRGRGQGWTRLLAHQRADDMATAICLSSNNPGFEAWFTEHGGIVVRYRRFEGGARSR